MRADASFSELGYASRVGKLPDDRHFTISVGVERVLGWIVVLAAIVPITLCTRQLIVSWQTTAAASPQHTTSAAAPAPNANEPPPLPDIVQASYTPPVAQLTPPHPKPSRSRENGHHSPVRR